MKTFTLIVLSLFLAVGLVGAVGAQAPSGSEQPKAPEGSSGSPAPAGDSKPTINIELKSESRDSGPDSGGSALPRAASERTTVFGLSPTAAVIAAAALLIVVILAIVAMTKSGGTTYVDRRS
jgi:preprotein translocase subunit SecG